MPAPEPTLVPVSDSALPALLLTATASWVVPVTEKELALMVSPPVPRESALRPTIDNEFTAPTAPA